MGHSCSLQDTLLVLLLAQSNGYQMLASATLLHIHLKKKVQILFSLICLKINKQLVVSTGRSTSQCLTVWLYLPLGQATSPCICIKEENECCSGRLVDKKESWIANWLNLEDGLNDCFMWGFNDWLSVKRLTASPDWLMDWLTYWLTDWLIDWLTNWQTDWWTDWLKDWTIEHWLYGFFLDQNDHWKIDWQVDRIFDCLSVYLSLSLTDQSWHYLATEKHSNRKKKIRWYTYPSS